jgi:hypothetical protein
MLEVFTAMCTEISPLCGYENFIYYKFTRCHILQDLYGSRVLLYKAVIGLKHETKENPVSVTSTFRQV